VLNRENALFHHLRDKAEVAGIGRILSFGRHPDADARLIEESLHATCSAVKAEICGKALDYCIGMPGSHWVTNSLAVLAAVGAAGADVAVAAAQLASLRALKGRGERHIVEIASGSFRVIDDSYNANPSSMRAAFEVLGRSSLGEGGRRIAVLGDMLELGAQSTEMHANLAGPLEKCGADLVFTCGPEMTALHEALPPPLRGAHAADSKALIDQLVDAVGAGDSVLVKGSLGSRMAVVVEALLAMGMSLPRAANGQ